MVTISGRDLELWAGRHDAQALLPELVRLLVLATTPHAIQVSFRADGGVHLAGWDGTVTNTEATAFVPDSTSGWELSVARHPAAKATEDYNKRSADPAALEPQTTTFVFVTAQRWPQKTSWASERKAEGRWRDVRAYDADDLATWLAQAPAVELWFARLIGKRPPDTVDLEGFWEAWSHDTNPPMPAELITAGRGDQLRRVQDWLVRPSGVLRIRAETREEAVAFFGAAVQECEESLRHAFLAAAVVARAQEALDQLVLHDGSLVLIPAFDSPCIGGAVARGHRVVVPIGREAAAEEGTVDLPPLPPGEVAKILQQLGVSEGPARSLASLARRSLLAFRRRLAVARELHQPQWAGPEHGPGLATLILAGSWDASQEEDRKVLARLVGKPYEDLELVSWAEREDPPVLRVGNVWSVTSPEDAWRLLNRYLTGGDLERFRSVATEVLSTPDPRFNLPVEQRHMAAILGKVPRYSVQLVRGMAEALAVMATTRAPADHDPSAASAVAGMVVRDVLAKANEDWRVWASLASWGVLQVLAEAAPDEFLAAVDRGLRGEDPVLAQLFADRDRGIFASSPHPGLLWALEVLAWSPDHLSYACVLLARLAEVDPGGTLADRPESTLRAIFLPWHPQTAAPPVRRLAALDRLRRGSPEVAWRVLTALLHDVQHPTARPRYREWGLEEQPHVTMPEYWRFVSEIVARLLADVRTDGHRWTDLIEAVEHLTSDLRAQVLDALSAVAADRIPGADSASVWHALRKVLSRHRSSPSADWALPRDDVERLQRLLVQFEPADEVERFGWLFGQHPNLPEGLAEDWQAHQGEVRRQRVEAVREVYSRGGLDPVIRLAHAAELPFEVGRSLSALDLSLDHEHEVMSHLASGDQALGSFALGFCAGRVERDEPEWVEETLTARGDRLAPEQKAELLLCLPPDPRAWDLAGALGEEVERRYWARCSPYAIRDEDAGRALRAFLENHNVEAAVHLAVGWSAAPAELIAEALELLLAAAPSKRIGSELGYWVGELLDRLQTAPEVDLARVARLEWSFLPVLRFRRAPRILHQQLARSPAFFVELVCAAFRAENEGPRNVSDGERLRAMRAYDLLSSWSWRTCPGDRGNGEVDEAELVAWVEEARALLQKARRRAIGDEMIGQVLSGSPCGRDGISPHEAVRAVIERMASEEIERGIEVGRYNSRGVVARALDEGGRQERALAEGYEKDAAALADRWPRTAAVLRRMAERYRADAAREDEEARRRLDLGD